MHTISLFPMTEGPKRRKARKRAGLKLRQLASEIGISHGHLRDLERGNRNFTLEMLARHDAAMARLTNPALASP